MEIPLLITVTQFSKFNLWPDYILILPMRKKPKTELFNFVEKGPNGPKLILIKNKFNELECLITAVKLHIIQKQ